MSLKIEYLNKEELKPYANNAKIHTAEQVEQIKNSIKEFGFNDPIAIWHENEIIEGHGRLLAAMELDEIEKIPVIRLDGLTDEQRKAYSIIHNKLAEKSSWDNDLLGEELKVLLDDFDFTDLGFGDFELTMLTEDFEPEPFDQEIEKEYGEHEEDFLAKKRLIITYTEDEKYKLMDILGIDNISKVIYDISELKG